MQCPLCKDTPTANKFWHDKENRSMNHLPWGVSCHCGACGSRGASQREVIRLYNDHALFLKQEQEKSVAPKKGFFRRMLDSLLNSGILNT